MYFQNKIIQINMQVLDEVFKKAYKEKKIKQRTGCQGPSRKHKSSTDHTEVSHNIDKGKVELDRPSEVRC